LKAQGVPKPQRMQRITETLKLVEMDTYLRSRPAELSGGQQQRIALARALVLQPKALLTRLSLLAGHFANFWRPVARESA
jgi:ABC-type methionine transport system ATPase subunit